MMVRVHRLSDYRGVELQRVHCTMNTMYRLTVFIVQCMEPSIQDNLGPERIVLNIVEVSSFPGLKLLYVNV